MKKTYIEPTVKEIIVNLEPMMADSIIVDVKDTDYNGEDSGIGAKEDQNGPFGW